MHVVGTKPLHVHRSVFSAPSQACSNPVARWLPPIGRVAGCPRCLAEQSCRRAYVDGDPGSEGMLAQGGMGCNGWGGATLRLAGLNLDLFFETLLLSLPFF